LVARAYIFHSMYRLTQTHAWSSPASPLLAGLLLRP